ncbi:hypothetical protein ABIC09_000028 [Bradyrhizobium sp. S3.12.5]|uniref:hypothetical protein n=1 Tax=Bradyrhizobium sp. S3.12.5 TaxID=3156386 RepID=UPI0033966916
MNPIPSLAAFLALAAFSVDAFAESPSTQKADSRPPEGVHVQPRGPGFVPNTSQDDIVQRRLTIFNGDQDAINTAFDRRLRICRGC